MRTILPALLALAALACGCTARPAPATHDDVGAARRIEADVRFLADDLLEGRETGTRGHEMAALYVARRMQALGLRPAGDDGTWLQPVRMLRAERARDGARLVVAFDGRETGLAFATDFLPQPSVAHPRAEATAPLVFAGYGVSAPELGHDDFDALDVRGRVAIVVQGAPSTLPNDERAYHASTARKARLLVAHGAVGMIVVRPPEDERRRAWAVDAGNWQRPAMRLLAADGTAVDDFPELVVRAAVRTAAAEALFAGAQQSLDAVWRARAAGTMRGFALPATVTFAATTTVTPIASANVVGLLPGRDAKLAGEHIVVSAHLDHLGTGARVAGDAVYNGAIDNALGIAAMLEAAATLASEPPRRSTLFLATTAEEQGLLGAQHFARSPTVPRAALVANVNLDMPVLVWPEPAWIGWGAEHTTLGPQLARAAQALGLALAPDPFPEEVAFVRSDQFRFVEQGVPAIYVGAMPAGNRAPGNRAAEAFFASRYHLPSDDADQPIDWHAAARLARLAALLVQEAGDADAPPAWLADDFFGRTFGGARGAQ